MENCFFYFLNPLINFQEINLYCKTFLFLQLNITSVQNHWRIYFFFSSGKHILNFLNFTHEEKLLFLFSFEPICIFNFPKKEKGKYGLISFFLGPKPAKAGSARLSARAQAAPRSQPGPGPAKCRGTLARLGQTTVQSNGAVDFDPTAARSFRAV